ncbi:hypothetical protein [Paenibacillus sp. UNC496MF]|uniref:hypothetical protein n=1 Tax=Paenibacillus sp. UNC496MF TaxID=1502753 RepID=UPI001C4328B9|nr:hypothetical protein [Paenibacillus sp. UNC496MF]
MKVSGIKSKQRAINDAFINKLHVEVWQDGKLHDTGGVIESHNQFEVVINGMHYMKHAFQFRIKK